MHISDRAVNFSPRDYQLSVTGLEPGTANDCATFYRAAADGCMAHRRAVALACAAWWQSVADAQSRRT